MRIIFAVSDTAARHQASENAFIDIAPAAQQRRVLPVGSSREGLPDAQGNRTPAIRIERAYVGLKAAILAGDQLHLKDLLWG